MNRLSGGAAFPSPGVLMDDGRGGEYQQGAYEGMTLRDYFAGQALSGLLADLPKTMYGLDWQQNAARGAYELADAMISERAK